MPREFRTAKFILLDEQQVAYSLVIHAVDRSAASRIQTVVIVLGGPGSRKRTLRLRLTCGNWPSKGREERHERAFNPK